MKVPTGTKNGRNADTGPRSKRKQKRLIVKASRKVNRPK
jgi:hypothetical protein